MNTKTTVFLAAIFALVVIGYLVLERSPVVQPQEATKPPASATAAVARDLLTEKLGTVVKVVVKKNGQPDWVFESPGKSEAGQAEWRMTAPFESKVASWEIDRYGRDLGRLQYEIAFQSGDVGGVTPADAGLAPPEATVTLTDDAGKSAAIEVGKPRSADETYVRLAGADQIVVAKQSLKTLFKAKALEYRDQQVCNFKPEDVKRVEITDRTAEGNPVQYAFVRDGSKWAMESPVSARATEKVDEMVRNVSRLRVAKWEDDAKDRLGVYGLEPSAITAKLTVEEQVPIEGDQTKTPEEPAGENKEQAEVEKPKTETKTTVYELHVSNRSPIGEDTKTYLRVGNETLVATIMKTTADKLRPVMSEWRDMHVTSADIERATRIEMTVAGTSASLSKKEGAWTFESDGGKAEDAEVKKLLTALKDMKAVAFVDATEADVATYGLAKPATEIRLTIPGAEAAERIAIGGPTDAATKRMTYLRRNELLSVGKVRAGDLETIERSPTTYRDRGIIEVASGSVEKLTIHRENAPTKQREELTFLSGELGWRMTAPVEAGVETQKVGELAAALGTLRAAAVASELGQTSAFGLDTPQVVVKLTYQPSAEMRVPEPAKGGEPAKEPVEVQPSSLTIELSATEHDGKFYAKRGDRPAIYEIDRANFDKLRAEYRAGTVFDFEGPKVTKFTAQEGGQSHAFVKKDGKWTYGSDADLPLDHAKVENLLIQIKDVKTTRFAAHSETDLARFGLTTPYRVIEVTLENGGVQRLMISDQSTVGAEEGNFATVAGRPGVFLLPPDALTRMSVDLTGLEKR
ncbi:MAG: DUF4340 domain-containing protein [Planctomycetota bacterium]